MLQQQSPHFLFSYFSLFAKRFLPHVNDKMMIKLACYKFFHTICKWSVACCSETQRFDSFYNHNFFCGLAFKHEPNVSNIGGVKWRKPLIKIKTFPLCSSLGGAWPQERARGGFWSFLAPHHVEAVAAAKRRYFCWTRHISRFSWGGSGDGGGVLCGGGSLMGTQAEEDLEGLARSIIAFKLN